VRGRLSFVGSDLVLEQRAIEDLASDGRRIRASLDRKEHESVEGNVRNLGCPAVHFTTVRISA
jgi:hypothetical protein